DPPHGTPTGAAPLREAVEDGPGNDRHVVRFTLLAQ
ncbi:hypothetical protein GGP52_003222, partial [Salinibacter ruber]|nr:hypothetical protein [Salinibacter ruber]